MEAYKIDTNKYPWCSGNNWAFASTGGGPGGSTNTPTLERLTTPVSYLNGKGNFYDPFNPKKYTSGPTLTTVTDLSENENKSLLWYTARNTKDSAVWGQTAVHDVDPFWWVLQASGPDATFDWVWQMVNTMTTDTTLNRLLCQQTIYDPTNGTVSRGSIWRAGGAPTGNGTSMYTVITQAP